MPQSSAYAAASYKALAATAAATAAANAPLFPVAAVQTNQVAALPPGYYIDQFGQAAPVSSISNITDSKARAVAAALATNAVKASAVAAAKASAAAAASQTSTAAKANTPYNIQFNLPPHKWSLPVDPTNLGYNKTKQTSASFNHGLRRAAMWFYDAPPAGDTAPSSAQGLISTSNAAAAKDKNLFGFQFLWNPTTLSNSISYNPAMVPSSADGFAQYSSLFTGMESMQVTAQINRVMDFAAFKANPGMSLSEMASSYAAYKNPQSKSKAETTEQQISDLLKRGTMADVEYIYRMVNGIGNASIPTFTNVLGRQTADLAFLSPTAIAIKFGPNPDSLSYVGWLTQVDVQHLQFTEDMIPLDTTVTISISAFSRTTLASN